MTSAAPAGLAFVSRGEALPPLAYLASEGWAAAKGPLAVYVPGFMSSGIAGSKASRLASWMGSRGQAYLQYDPTGLNHSASEASKKALSLRQWLDDLLCVLDELCHRPTLLVGSSMGAWLSVLAAEQRPNKVAGLCLVASGPDFIRRSYEEEDAKSPGLLAKLKASGEQVWQPRNGVDFPVSQRLLEEGTALEVLSREAPLDVRCPVRLLHSARDDVAPLAKAQELMEKVEAEDVEMHVTKFGSHLFDSPREMAALQDQIDKLLAKISQPPDQA